LFSRLVRLGFSLWLKELNSNKRAKARLSTKWSELGKSLLQPEKSRGNSRCKKLIFKNFPSEHPCFSTSLSSSCYAKKVALAQEVSLAKIENSGNIFPILID